MARQTDNLECLVPDVLDVRYHVRPGHLAVALEQIPDIGLGLLELAGVPGQ